MTIIEAVAVSVTGAGGLGILVGWGISWGKSKVSLSTLDKSHDSLKSEFIKHKDNSSIHIDPLRDTKAADDLKTMIVSNFSEVKSKLSAIDQRCESRGKTCGDHFSQIQGQVYELNGRLKADKQDRDDEREARDHDRD